MLSVQRERMLQCRQSEGGSPARVGQFRVTPAALATHTHKRALDGQNGHPPSVPRSAPCVAALGDRRRAGRLGPQRKAKHAGVAPPHPHARCCCPPRPPTRGCGAHSGLWVAATVSFWEGEGEGGVGRWGAAWQRRPPQLLTVFFFLDCWGVFGGWAHALSDGSNVGARPAGLVRNLLWAAADALGGGAGLGGEGRGASHTYARLLVGLWGRWS